MKNTSIKTYSQKRDFKKTSEPRPQRITKKQKKLPIFVIQEHHARHLHWDLRLEIDGVMPSWALPKGPSLNPTIKRLAVRTEDHPIPYAHFEGTIPEGEYGAGTVMVWDIGTYENLHMHDDKLVPMKTCLQQGRMEFLLHGTKLHGAYVMIRLKDGKSWLFFKKNDAYARDTDILKENKSALTGRTIAQIKNNET